MKIKFTLLSLGLVLFIPHIHAQMKIVIMGSSTAYGIGASAYTNSWAGKIQAYKNQNASDGLDTIFYNISYPGYDTYQEMPTSFIPPPGRPLPDVDFNVTKALSYNPDVVIINLPSNDISYGYAKSEMISNLRYMSAAIFAAGAKCFVTTPQPRNDFDVSYRDSLLSMVDSVKQSFGPYAIDFWEGLVTTDGLLALKEVYRADPSPLHVNNAGHNLLFEKIRDSYIFNFFTVVNLLLTNFEAIPGNNAVILKWHTENQEPNTDFEIQQSPDGINLKTVLTRHIAEARSSFDYVETDPFPLHGRRYYRIKVTTGSRQFYSPVISIIKPENTLQITNLVVDNNYLSLNINLPENSIINMDIVNVAGVKLIQQKAWISSRGNIKVPIKNLNSGLYYVRIYTTDGKYVVKAFNKINN